MKRILVVGAIASVSLWLSACNPEKKDNDDDQGNETEVVQVGQLALVGGALHGCSSMVTSDCVDWDAYRTTELASLTDEEIRSPVELGVSLTDANIDAVLNDAAWDANLYFAEAAEEILLALQNGLTSHDYLYASWEDFRSAFINYGDTSIVDGEGNTITGNVLWFNSSDAQYSTLERLERVDETFQYTVTAEKVDAVLGQSDIAALDSVLLNALSVTLDDSVYASPVSQADLIDYFAEINVVDASVNGWKLFKKFLSDDEFDFMLATLDPENDDTFLVDATHITTIENDTTVSNGGAGWDEYNRSDLVTVLNYLRNQAGGDITYAIYAELKAAVTSTYLDESNQSVAYHYELGSDVWAELSTLEQTLVLQGLVDPLVNYSRPVEYVHLEGSDSTESINVVKAIVEKAKGDSAETPNFLIMTSSSNNSYDAVDFYVSLFNQAGASAQWLPIDRAYQDARMLQRCDLLNAIHADYASDAHVNLLYPDYAAAHNAACEDPQTVLEMIADADAIFINGGGQRRSLDALMPIVNGDRIDSAEMALIRQRFNANELLISGTSAGTAVQGGGYLNNDSHVNPMIDGGTAHDVLVSGYDEGIAVFEGGLGLFNYGITDTHFSERARETRLIKLAQQANVQFGFGVDETTALFVDKLEEDGLAKAEFRVVGKSGVFIADLADAHVRSGDGDVLDIEQVSIHYLRQGDRAELSADDGNLEVMLAGDIVSVDSSAATVLDNDVLYEDHFRNMASDFVQTGAAHATGTSYEDNPTIQVELSRSAATVTAKQGDSASYTNVLMRISAP